MPDLTITRSLKLTDLEQQVAQSLDRYARLSDPPRHWRYLPEELCQREIVSAFDLQLLLDKIRRLGARKLVPVQHK